ncbi:MAG: SH3 domain-containing protein [Chloroflexi bacterium]|nr:SH3 domain-containing protein [Chloroflexota bacterium]
MKTLFLSSLILIALAACTGTNSEQAAGVATATLAPIVSMTPRFTATPEITRTPPPTFTYTPSITPIPPTPSNTPTPTMTPVVTGIVASLQRVNVRSGPGETFDAFTALDPGTGVTVIGTNDDGSWYLIEMENGDQGWISARLLRVEEPPTPFPTATATPNLTALFLGTPLPTALIGGGTITPTPPRSAVTATPATPQPPGTETQPAPTNTAALPVINIDAINQTATALVTNIVRPTISGQEVTATFTPFVAAGVTAPAGTPPASGGSGPRVQRGVDVLAYCIEFGVQPPSNLLAGSSMEVFWGWYATSPALLQDHLDHVIYEVRVNGTLLQNWRSYVTPARQEDDGYYHIYWFVPVELPNAGQYVITYRVTWDTQITDGIDSFGPGSNNPVQTGSCTVNVR